MPLGEESDRCGRVRIRYCAVALPDWGDGDGLTHAASEGQAVGGRRRKGRWKESLLTPHDVAACET
jgi:hypothetical protein